MTGDEARRIVMTTGAACKADLHDWCDAHWCDCECHTIEAQP